MHFLNRYGISLRITTNQASKVPEDFRQVIVEWMRFNRRNSVLHLELGEVIRAVGPYDLHVLLI